MILSNHFIFCPLSYCLQFFPASGCFLMSLLFTSGGQSIGALVSASVLPMNIQGWFPLGFTGLITLQSKGLSIIFSSTTIWKHKFFGTQTSLVAQMVKHLPMMQETWVRFLGGEDPLEKEMATHSTILVWRIPWTEKPGRMQSIGSQKVGHDWRDLACRHTLMYILFFIYTCLNVSSKLYVCVYGCMCDFIF